MCSKSLIAKEWKGKSKISLDIGISVKKRSWDGRIKHGKNKVGRQP